MPYLKPEYFLDNTDRLVFGVVVAYFEKYDKPPSLPAVKLELINLQDIQQEVLDGAEEVLLGLVCDLDTAWLVDQAETFCKDQALYLAMQKGMVLFEDRKAREGVGDLIMDALAVCFDASIGHDYLDDAEERYASYHKKIDKIPLSLPIFNKATDGGLTTQTLNAFMAGVHVGKTALLCNEAAALLEKGYNVLYITLEMAEKEIAKRIDARLLKKTTEELQLLTKDRFVTRMEDIKARSQGRLIIKQFPTGDASAMDFRRLIRELKIKKKFVPKVVCIDYLGICSSYKIRLDNKGGSYGFLKSVSEELRAMAILEDVALLTAVQVTRSGFGDSDAEMDDIAESFGINHTLDLLWLLTMTEELEELGQVSVKQLKNRYQNMRKKEKKRFLVGFDIDRQTFYEIDGQSDNKDSRPPFEVKEEKEMTISERAMTKVKRPGGRQIDFSQLK